jgi:cell division protein FtsX
VSIDRLPRGAFNVIVWLKTSIDERQIQALSIALRQDARIRGVQHMTSAQSDREKAEMFSNLPMFPEQRHEPTPTSFRLIVDNGDSDAVARTYRSFDGVMEVATGTDF